MLDDCRTQGLTPPKTHWARALDTPPFCGYPLRPGLTFTYLGVKVDEHARVQMADGTPADNIFAAGEIMAGNILGKGYLAGIGMTIGTVFGRIAGDEAARHATRIAGERRHGMRLASQARRRQGMRLTDVIAEGDRILTICNACRYCEGYCAVFPAMERRLTFAAGDLDYLANLCHNCGECYYACQYAPPHEFAVNVPQTLAQIRGTTWRRHAWPQAFARLYDANALATSLLLVLALVVLMLALPGPGAGTLFAAPAKPGDFYAVMPHSLMAGIFSVAALYVIVALAIGYRSFCRDIGEPLREMASPAAGMEALRDGLSLRYLHGGGAGCRHPDEASAGARRVFHHLTFYGFMLCFAATVVGTIYHYGLGLHAPYAYTSLPVILGTVGGIGLIAGPLGFLWLRTRRERDTSDPDQLRLNAVLAIMLLLTSVTGLALLALRGTGWLGPLLIVHLAFVLALFLTLPYGKFVHALYRLAALTRYALERKRPALNVGAE